MRVEQSDLSFAVFFDQIEAPQPRFYFDNFSVIPP